LWIPLKEGIGGERRPKDRVKTRLILQITLLDMHFSYFTPMLGYPPLFNWQWLISSAERERVSKSIANRTTF
jgi:hypothetical protein